MTFFRSVVSGHDHFPFMNERDRLKQLLLELSYENREVTLASGQKSNFYIDTKQTSLHPEGARLLGSLLFKEIEKHFPEVKAVGGPTLGADPLVTALSLTSFMEKKPIPAFIIRKEPKTHGTQAWIEGARNLSAGMPVLVIEDVVTTGGSSLKAVDRARESGLDVRGILAVIDRQEGGSEVITGKGLRFVSLFTKAQLLAP